MPRIAIAACLAFALMSPTCFAQSQSPYAGFETRKIKALSDQQISDLRAGLGMSLALAAELNGYPGPRHTVELATQLGLSETQLAKAKELFAGMTAESIPIGERLIAEEAQLDAQFSDKTVTLDTLLAATQAIGSTQAVLRATHLKYHLLTLQLLTPEQVHRYTALRGYIAPVQHDPGQHNTQ
jgi:hypothetical protein